MDGSLISCMTQDRASSISEASENHKNQSKYAPVQ